MKIEKLLIKNFRQFEELTVEFDEITTSLVGVNGAGKTTILDAINIVLSQFRPESKITIDDFKSVTEPIVISVLLDGYYFINFEDGYTTRTVPSRVLSLTIDRRKKSANKVFNSEFTSSYTMVPYEYSAISDLELDSEADTSSMPERVFKFGNNFKYTRKSSGDGGIGPLQLSAVSNAKGLPSAFYYDSKLEKQLKHGFSTLWSKLTEELDWRFFEKSQSFSEKEASEYLGAISTAKKTIDKTSVGGRRQAVVGELKKQAENLLGEKYKDLDISFLNPNRPHKNSDLSVFEDGRPIALTRLGSGERAIIALLLAVIVAKQSKNPIILLIDELETHLHPQLMQEVVDHLEAQGVQLIYTTHSENLINLGRWRTIKRLDLGVLYPQNNTLDEEIESKKISEHLDDISKYYYDKTVLKNEDAQVLFGSKALIVEGAKDKYCIPYASAKIDKDISDVDTIISANGKTNIPHYQIICAAFGIDCFVVYDTDDESGSADAEINSRIASVAQNKYAFVKSFETSMGVKKMNAIIEKIDDNDIPEDVKGCISQIETWKESK